MPYYALGLDFGTESCRAIIVDVNTGDEVAQAVEAYEHGVIDEQIPGMGIGLERDWALQHPEDYIKAMRAAIFRAKASSGICPDEIIGIGVDFTACTLMPVKACGTPLCLLSQYRPDPHSWVKLWKHHAAQPEADAVNEIARLRGERFLDYYGGKVSSEWAIPKMLQVFNESREIYEAADRFIEAGDWIVWKLTGVESRNTCAAGYKAMWNHESGYVSREFLKALDPGFEGAVDDKLAGQIVAPGRRAGTLTHEAALLLGLSAGTPVSAATIDAHSGVAGCGVSSPGAMVLIMGTSTCHMAMSEEPVLFKGYAGLVKDGIIPGLYGYEYGQSAVGDIFAWFIENSVPYTYYLEAQARGIGLHDLLAEKAAGLGVGESGLVALDWHNGNRSILMDASLKGLIWGYSLGTTAHEVYRCLIEATAFGTRKIIDTHEAGAGQVKEIYACGGLTKNWLIMQIYADVLGRPVKVASSAQPVALGAAIFGALAAGAGGGGYDSAQDAIQAMAKPASKTYAPIDKHTRAYQEVYRRYLQLHDCFGVQRIV